MLLDAQFWLKNLGTVGLGQFLLEFIYLIFV